MEKNQQMGQLVIFLLVLIFRIYALFHCSQKAKALNRSSNFWGFFGFSAPILAMIWISYKKPIIDWEENAPLNSSNSKNENETKREIIIEETNEAKATKSEAPKYVKSNQLYLDQKNLNVDANQSPKKITNQNKQQDYYEQNRPVLKKIDKSSDRY